MMLRHRNLFHLAIVKGDAAGAGTDMRHLCCALEAALLFIEHDTRPDGQIASKQFYARKELDNIEKSTRKPKT